jgi:hypothetical protein
MCTSTAGAEGALPETPETVTGDSTVELSAMAWSPVFSRSPATANSAGQDHCP